MKTVFDLDGDDTNVINHVVNYNFGRKILDPKVAVEISSAVQKSVVEEVAKRSWMDEYVHRRTFGKDFFERQYQQQPNLDYECGIQVWHDEELAGVLNQVISPGQPTLQFIVSDGPDARDFRKVEIPIGRRQVRLDKMQIKMGRISSDEFKRHFSVPSYATVTDMIATDELRFEWAALNVDVDQLAFLFDMDSFQPF